jgi:O-antigen ligase
VIVLPAVVLAIALGSTAVQKRLDETFAGSSPTQSGDLSSTGIRIELMRNGLNLAREHGLTGGGFSEYLRLSGESAQQLYGNDPNRRPYLERHWVRTENPHNEYLMQLVGGGVAALTLFLAWLVAPMLRKGRSQAARSALVGIGLAFAFGCLFNSLLMDFVEGHFYVVLMTWLLARSVGEAEPPRPAPA